MPWKESSVVEERMRFVLEYERGLSTMAELCRRYGISRETGYERCRRYQLEGMEGLRDRSRAPLRAANQTAAEIEAAVLELRREHMRWGPRKLKCILEQAAPQIVWPAASTIGAMIAREGLAIRRKQRRRVPPYTEPFAGASAPNRVWCVDFKGWFRTQDGARIDPLTLSDAYSRYLLRCQAVEKTDTQRVQAIFAAAFHEYGLPEAIRSDNGAPFAARAVGGVSRLSLWWMKLGIRPERIQAGHPEQNGRHERMHRTLKQETASPPAATARAQQRVFDRFRRDYNEIRPHEALLMQTPASLYGCSPRIYSGRVREPEYGSLWHVRRVMEQGQFRWKSQRVFLGTVFQGERIGLLPCDERYFTVYFAQFPVACFDSYQLTILSLSQAKALAIDEAGPGNVTGEEGKDGSSAASENAARFPLSLPPCDSQPINDVSGMSPV
jgi:putative transposase